MFLIKACFSLMSRFKFHSSSVVSLDLASNFVTIKNSCEIISIVKVTLHVSLVSVMGSKCTFGTSFGFEGFIGVVFVLLELVSCQKPSMSLTTKPVARWRIRNGDVVGLLVTLRGSGSFLFFDKLLVICYSRQRSLSSSGVFFDFYSRGLRFRVVDVLGFPDIGQEFDFFFPVDFPARSLPLDISVVLSGGFGVFGNVTFFRNFQYPVFII